MPGQGATPYHHLLRERPAPPPNGVWDICSTYISVAQGFIYFTTVLDWYSRYVLSWESSNTLDVGFCLQALATALRQASAPYIFISDQVSPFTCARVLCPLQPPPAPLFAYGVPRKNSLEEFRNRHFTFNVSFVRFAWLTGRSLPAFKRGFHAAFHETPSCWLVHQRLQEACFLLTEKHHKPSDIHVNRELKDLSRFSFAVKNQFSLAASPLLKQQHNAGAA